jgi:hypothetical protein
MSDSKPLILGDWLVSPMVVLLSMAILILTAIAVTRSWVEPRPIADLFPSRRTLVRFDRRKGWRRLLLPRLSDLKGSLLAKSPPRLWHLSVLETPGCAPPSSR